MGAARTAAGSGARRSATVELSGGEARGAVKGGLRQRGWRLGVKRVLDVCAAAVGLVLVSPLLAVVALALRVRQGGPVLFHQQRPGLGGRPFELLKFRTMLDAVGSDGRPLPDAERLTPIGRFLRATSLDELPQLWNVLRGDVSLVGPRPLLMQYLPRYSAEQARRHDVLPGITGWAQVNGRNAISWEQKFTLDVWYVDNWSLALDLQILLMTAARVLSRSGISQGGHATMPEFMGSDAPKDAP
jgi:lipopolysaccharide/colanic/teichoic acid biosynthesis glycosyltransferase